MEQCSLKQTAEAHGDGTRTS